jgi:aspartate aminotransferase
MLSAFKERRDMIVKMLNKIKGIKCIKPEGAFYVFPDVSAHYKGKIKNSLDFSAELLDKVKVAVVPGEAFGDDNCIRLSYACSTENIKEGVKRIKEFCESLG